MISRAMVLGVEMQFVESVPWDDPSIRPPDWMIESARQLNGWNSYAWSTAHGHMSALQEFVNDGQELGVIIEDDVQIRRDLPREMPCIISNFRKMDLDVLLMGYLIHHPPSSASWIWPNNGVQFTYHEYPNYLYGAQMYMINRRYAIDLLHQCGPRSGYAFRTLVDRNIPQYVSDWLITKDTTRRALISPMIGVEEGKTQSAENKYSAYHQQCHDVNYDSSVHI
jgi:hypothetical protein